MATEKTKGGYRYKARNGGTDILCDFNCAVTVRKSRGKTGARSTSGSKSKSNAKAGEK